MILRLDRGVPEVQHLLLNRLHLAGAEAHGREHWLAILLRHADDDVTAAEIVEVIREGAKRVQHCQRIPPLLELQALPLDGRAAEQIVDVDGQRHDKRLVEPSRGRNHE